MATYLFSPDHGFDLSPVRFTYPGDPDDANWVTMGLKFFNGQHTWKSEDTCLQTHELGELVSFLQKPHRGNLVFVEPDICVSVPKDGEIGLKFTGEILPTAIRTFPNQVILEVKLDTRTQEYEHFVQQFRDQAAQFHTEQEKPI